MRFAGWVTAERLCAPTELRAAVLFDRLTKLTAGSDPRSCARALMLLLLPDGESSRRHPAV